MRVLTPKAAATHSDDHRFATVGHRDAESLFRTNPISEIRNVEASTRKQIEDKKEELRQLVGNRYRDLIDSADSIVLMKNSCQSISGNISSIHGSIRSLSLSQLQSESPSQSSATRTWTYDIASRVKYLIDTPENIWGCLDEGMFLEAASRYVRAKQAHHKLFFDNGNAADGDQKKILSNFPILQHQWQIVESFRTQISQRSRDRLLDRGLTIGAYADALAAVAIIDELEPKQVLDLFLESRKSWVSRILVDCDAAASASFVVVSVFCDVLGIIQVSVGQVGELFLQVMNDMPLFYKVILGSPPASHLFGGISNPDEEVKLWKLFRDKLESIMIMLDKDFIASACKSWLRECAKEMVNKINGRYLIDAIGSGHELALAEKSIRETMESKQVLEGSMEWLKTVFGSEIELPWSRIRELVLEDDSDLWDEIFEDAFLGRMKVIIDLRFRELTGTIDLFNMINAVGDTSAKQNDVQGYLNRPSTIGGVWFLESNARKAVFKVQHEENEFQTCLNSYFGPEVSQIRELVDMSCRSILEDMLSFLESPKASQRLKDLAPYLQTKCNESLSAILMALKSELDKLYAIMERGDKDVPATVSVERSLFIGRLLFALQTHSKHVPLILGSPRSWANDTTSALGKMPSVMKQSKFGTDSPACDTPGRQALSGTKRQNSLAAAALFGTRDSAATPHLEELTRVMGDLGIRAYSLWISWLCDELSAIVSQGLKQDDALSLSTPWRGWENIIVKQEHSNENESEMKISLPSMPSLYIISFLFRACEEVHRVGGHVLDKKILQKLASGLLEKIIGMFEDFLFTKETSGLGLSEKGVLQVLLDVKFATDVLSGGDSSSIGELSGNQKPRLPVRRKQDQRLMTSVIRERCDQLLKHLSRRLDPIDWLTFEPYLWENEKQSYLRHAVLFGFFVQLNRMYTDTVQKLPTNAESNILRCSTVPRFKYLPISAPALSSRGTKKTFAPSSNEPTSRSSWNSLTNAELSQKMNLDDNSSLGVAAPFLKSFMQVGSRFGESTLKLGSILTDGQVGIFKDKSTSAMSFGDILPAQAAGLLSSFTAPRSDY
ncbi:hypothetical protein QN277_025371 [Acacia crassicarpa]|uniref:Conserved oligomeric Golgi complex subunit 1 n=1 Tax=Acacia crassicarpa TaxID=499986 RepID=A0AAE1MP33_9FABA|nr:hypothetical protein QN277_025371 [Acacia crassicarpa]